MRKFFKVLYVLSTIVISSHSSECIKNRIIILGAAGGQGSEYVNLLKDSYNIVGLVDSNFQALSSKFSGTNFNIYESIEEIDSSNYDAAIVCLPHILHKTYTEKLLSSGKTVIKEKPLATSIQELESYLDITNRFNNLKLFTIVQRNFNPIFIEAEKEISRIGKIYSYKYEYSLNIPSITTGWRSSYNMCFGGVLLDMGYHLIDIIIKLFDEPINVAAIKSFCYEKMSDENLEDSISVLMSHKNGIAGNIIVNRHSSNKNELFEINGENGTMLISPLEIKILNRHGAIIFEKNIKKSDINKKDMFDFYFKSENDINFLKEHINHHISIVKTINNIYNSNIN